MRLFNCTSCGQRVFFESFACARCQSSLGYLPDRQLMSALRVKGPADGATWESIGGEPRRYRRCLNAVDHSACNWMIEESDPLRYCRSCRLTLLIPDLDAPDALSRWHTLERAKRQLVHHIATLGLPLDSRRERPRDGLAFVFLAQGDLGRETVLTGHANGLVTINVNEADDSYRETMRKEMREAYRTVLGHFRHEVGHYYWDRLVRASPRLEAFRSRFGDERQDYAARCKAHYAEGPPSDWQDRFVSAYATMHPWEDWAESWSHYLHITDTLDTATAYRVRTEDVEMQSSASDDADDFDAIIRRWCVLSETLNSLNRSMGLPDPYPFVLSRPAIAKLAFVHQVVQSVPRVA